GPRPVALQTAHWSEVCRDRVLRPVVHALARIAAGLCGKHAAGCQWQGDTGALQRQHRRHRPPIADLAVPARYRQLHHGRGLPAEGWRGFHSHPGAAGALAGAGACREREMKMWSGRFGQAQNPDFEQWQRSFSFDRVLLPYEVAASRAHAAALATAGGLDERELAATISALDQIAREGVPQDDDPTIEDVHHFVEKRLVELAGEVGYKLHTGR